MDPVNGVSHYNLLPSFETVYGLGQTANDANASPTTGVFGASVPEPASLVIMSLGIVGVALLRGRYACRSARFKPRCESLAAASARGPRLSTGVRIPSSHPARVWPRFPSRRPAPAPCHRDGTHEKRQCASHLIKDQAAALSPILVALPANPRGPRTGTNHRRPDRHRRPGMDWPVGCRGPQV